MRVRILNGQENLCDHCINCIVTCSGSPEFGDGTGFDNVVICDIFEGGARSTDDLVDDNIIIVDHE